MNNKIRICITLLLLAGKPNGIIAQDLPVPGQSWMSIETQHFTVHYPSAIQEWTLQMTTRLESVYDAVTDVVGNTPARKVTIIVDDPLNVSNGSAWPGPVIYLWPTPPEPRSAIGENRGWSELLSLHEYVHVAHFTRPSRNPLSRFLVSFLPFRLDPIMMKAPRWMLEGYATYLEGRLTGSGRPHGTWRPAILRKWALEGQLPTYEELNISTDFFGGSMAYLAGSAFLEWLIERSGDESLPNLWIRLTARKKRSFNAAFSGVFGGPPSELYGRFSAELSAQAMGVEDRLRLSGVEEGDIYQRLNWATGDPSVSPDGKHVAIVLRSRDEPSRLVVWKWEEDPPSDEELDRIEKERLKDPEDVPGIEWKPPQKEPVAVLYPSGGRSHSRPRFMPDGKRLLVIRPEALSDGRVRRDLFIWDFEGDHLRRITRGGAIHDAYPSPDGSVAVGIQSLYGRSDIVEIDLENGAITTIRESGIDRAFYRPRYSPDGNRIVASRQVGSDWRLVMMDRDGRNMNPIETGDNASRYDAEFTADGQSLVLVSSKGGILNLEILDLNSGEVTPLTRVTGAAVAPAINNAAGEILFLNLKSRGYDLNRIELDQEGIGQVVETAESGNPAARVPVISIPEYRAVPLNAPTKYGFGPRQFVVLPQGTYAREGNSYGFSIASTDPVGKLSWTLGGLIGEEGAWQGGSFRMAYRSLGPVLNVEIFSARQYPSKNRDKLITPAELDVEYSGADLFIDLRRNRLSRAHRYWLGATFGQINGPQHDNLDRIAGFAGLHFRYQQTPGNTLITQSLTIEGATGSTGEADWNRFLASLSLGVGKPGKTLLLGQVVYGETGGDPVQFEYFAVGGIRPTLFDGSVLSQRISMPALPVGFLNGRRYASYRGEFLIGSILSFYYWAGMAGEELNGWEKIYGQEVILDSDSVPFIKIPGLQLRIGTGIRVDEPYPKKSRLYVTMVWRP